MNVDVRCMIVHLLQLMFSLQCLALDVMHVVVAHVFVRGAATKMSDSMSLTSRELVQGVYIYYSVHTLHLHDRVCVSRLARWL